MAAGVLVLERFRASRFPHRSTLRLRVEMSSSRMSQTWTGLATPSLGGQGQDVALAEFDPERTQGVIVECW